MNQYGYIVLFMTLMLELIIFGIPTEILMSYSGFLVFQGRMGWIPSILAAGIGSCVGITISYFIGRRLGYPFFHKYGHKVHMGLERFDKFSGWFSRYGNALIAVAYFIPGVRHITGYFSGIIKMSFRKFAVFAYLGAFLWVFTFISLGKVLGPQWQTFHDATKKYLVIGGILIAIAIAAFYVFKRLKGHILRNVHAVMTKSPLRARFRIIGTAAVFVVLFVLMIGLIQDYMANEFGQFNSITTLIIHVMFGANTEGAIRSFAYLSSPIMLIPVTILTMLWILARGGRDRFLESFVFLIVVIGGMFLEEGLQAVFGQISPVPVHGGLPSAFPSERSLLSLTIWGFFAYLIARHTKGVFLAAAATASVLAISLLLGISHVYFGVQRPSDIIAGYVFAGVWLSLNVVVFDILRELRRIPV